MINNITLGRILVACDTAMDWIPFISTVNTIVDLVIKKLILDKMDVKDVYKNYYYCHLKEKEYDYMFLAIPWLNLCCKIAQLCDGQKEVYERNDLQFMKTAFELSDRLQTTISEPTDDLSGKSETAEKIKKLHKEMTELKEHIDESLGYSGRSSSFLRGARISLAYISSNFTAPIAHLNVVLKVRENMMAQQIHDSTTPPKMKNLIDKVRTECNEILLEIEGVRERLKLAQYDVAPAQ